VDTYLENRSLAPSIQESRSEQDTPQLGGKAINKTGTTDFSQENGTSFNTADKSEGVTELETMDSNTAGINGVDSFVFGQYMSQKFVQYHEKEDEPRPVPLNDGSHYGTGPDNPHADHDGI
jgi:hypothetical protein